MILQDQEANFISADYRHISMAMARRLIGRMLASLDPNEERFSDVEALGTAECLTEMRMYEPAHELLKDPKFNGSKTARLHRARANLSFRQGEFTNGFASFERAIELAPEDVTLLSGVALNATRYSSHDHAKEMIARYVAHPDHNPEKLEHLERSLSNREEDALHYTLAEVLEKARSALQNKDMDTFASALNAKPEVASHGVQIGVAYGKWLREQGNPKAAEPIYYSLIDRFPKAFLAYQGLTHLYIEEGRFEDAQNTISACELSVDNNKRRDVANLKSHLEKAIAKS